MSGRPMPSNGDYPAERNNSLADAGAPGLAGTYRKAGTDPSSNGLGHSEIKDLEEVLRRDWAAFSQKLEERLQEQFHRQAIRVEHLIAGRLVDSTFVNIRQPKTHDQYLDHDQPSIAAVPQATSSTSLRRVNFDADSTAVDFMSPKSPRRHSAPETGAFARLGEPSSTSLGTRRLEERPRESSAGQDVGTAIMEGLGTSKATNPVRSNTTKASSLNWDTDQAGIRKAAYRRCSTWIDWWVALEEPPVHGRLGDFIDGKFFELVCACVIAINSAMTVRTTNIEAATLSDDNSVLAKILSFSFVAFYSIELVLKLYVHRVYFFCNNDMAWNIFDFVLVAFALYDVVVSEILISHSGPNISYMRTMRVLRLAKILRVVRVMRFFSELRLILNSVLGSVVSLFWSIVMLALMFLIFSLVFVQGATSTLQNLSSDMLADVGEELDNLRSVQAGMLMLYQACTGGEDWKNFYRSIQHTGNLNCALFLFFVAFAQFALLNILTGIFVENAMKLAQPDRDTLALQRRKEEVSEADELRSLCKAMDQHKTGYIGEAEFVQQLQSSQFKARLAVLGLDIRDAELFFKMIASEFENGQVEIEAFVNGCMRLKGSASSLDLQTLMFGTKLIHANQIRFYTSLEDRLDKVLESSEKKPDKPHTEI